MDAFDRDGYVILREFLSEDEVRDIERVYDEILAGKRVDLTTLGRDFCDMSATYSTPAEKFNMVNVVLPTRHVPEWKGNVLERKVEEVAHKWFLSHDDEAMMDYDQLLAKKPGKTDAIFAWHQDLGYWPVGAPNNRTMTFSLALDDADEENGCLMVIPESHKEPQLRPHRPAAKAGGDGRSDAHTLVADVDLNGRDTVQYLHVRRGDVTIHNERIVHGSGGNSSPTRWRRTYVIAYRSRGTVEYERSIGFTHSHNDQINWKTHLALNQAREQCGASGAGR